LNHFSGKAYSQKICGLIWWAIRAEFAERIKRFRMLSASCVKGKLVFSLTNTVFFDLLVPSKHNDFEVLAFENIEVISGEGGGENPNVDLKKPTGVGRGRLKSSAFAPAKSRLALACSPFLIASLCSSSIMAAPASSPVTAPVIGRAPTLTMPTMNNLSASGRTPAQGDDMRATYVYSDLDGDLENSSLAQVQWFADTVAIPGATALNFLPTAAQNKKFLTVQVQPGSMPPADPDMALAPMMSAVSLSPVLPPRAQLAAAYSPAPNGLRWGDAYMYCAGQSKRLPSISELQTLFTTYTRADAVGTSGGGI
jgi:hypothetical protein